MLALAFACSFLYLLFGRAKSEPEETLSHNPEFNAMYQKSADTEPLGSGKASTVWRVVKKSGVD